MTEISQRIAESIRRRVRTDGADLRNQAVAAEYVRDEVRRYSERALGGAAPLLTDEAGARRDVLATLTGLGPLQAYLDDPTVEEIWINSPSRVFVARNGVSELTPTILTDAEVRDLVERMLQDTGRRVDLSSPFVDASLPDGSRLHVVIPDVTRRHFAVNIRKFTTQTHDLSTLTELRSLDDEAAGFLQHAARTGLNILVCGATHTGKTTLLNALLSVLNRDEHIVTVEETFELNVASRDVVALQCRQPSLEGTGEVTLRRLVKEALRMRPDRLVVGEVREAESLDLLIALNSGVPGMCTVHANSAQDAMNKLCTLPLLAGRNIDSSFIVPTVASCIDLVVHCAREPDGFRHIESIAAVDGTSSGSRVDLTPLFVTRDQRLVRTPRALPDTDKFARHSLRIDGHSLAEVA